MSKNFFEEEKNITPLGTHKQTKTMFKRLKGENEYLSSCLKRPPVYHHQVT